MRTEWDAYRSLAKYLAEALADLDPDADWDVRLAEEQGTFERPLCMVYAAAPATVRGQQYHSDVTAPFGAHLYPEPDEDAHRSLERAERVKAAVEAAFTVGVGDAHPYRVPLWDYEGVPIDAAARDRARCDYLRVDDLSVNRTEDDDDPTLHTVVLSLRCGYRRRGRVPSHEHVLQDVRIGFEP